MLRAMPTEPTTPRSERLVPPTLGSDAAIDTRDASSAATLRVEASARAKDELPVDLPAFVAMLGQPAFDSRYDARDVLGRGGMGEVRLYLDRRIGRDVAHKSLRKDLRTGAIALERFVREARVQGQLEHPAVVPVYDLGLDPSGQIFFTMKRVRGTPLDAVLDAIAEGDPEVTVSHSRRRLLSAFVQVCRAIDFAHSRGVLHRDLKPGNVMLGEYGEVHVLDWGLAKIVGKRDARSEARANDDEAIEDAIEEPASGDSGSTPTLAGSVLGTPGYMSPEQARGETDGLDGRTDVYSLGAILFEIVYREPLHEGPGAAAKMSSTLVGPEMRASRRTHGADVPPELEALCAKACALDPDYRVPSARALADAVERFLDGERDDERRKEIAKVHVEKATALAARADAGEADARTEALRELGRALVLDPTHGPALSALESMLVHVPSPPPREAQEEIARAELSQRRGVLRATAMRHAFWALLGPLMFVTLPLRDGTLAAGMLAIVLALFALTVFVWRARAGSRPWWFVLVGSTAVTIGLLSSLFGPFVFVPSLAATYTIFYAPQTTVRERNFLHAVLALAVLLPGVLGELGVVPRLATFLPDGSMVVRSPIFGFEEGGTLLILLVSNLLLVVVPGTIGGRFFERLRTLEARSIVQGWYLRQLLPKR
jgi:serine/threonine-protein kinase